MRELSHQARTITVVVIAVLFVCIGWVKFAFWQSNRISPQFQEASESAYHMIQECDSNIAQEESSFPICVKKTKDALALLKKIATTQGERLKYAVLNGYLDAVRDCRRDWELSDLSTEAKERQEQLVRFRRDLANRGFH